MSDRDVAAFFASLSRELLAERDEQPTLARICARALEVVPAADYCGLTVRRRRGRLETVAASDETATRSDELQYRLGEGPCLESVVDAETFVVQDVARDTRWPRWGPQAAQLGIGSLISVQLSSSTVGKQDGLPLGAINIYARRCHAFARDDVDMAVIFAAHAGNALASARLVNGLETAMHGRHLIGVAQGILMQRYQLSLQQSFDALQRYSNHANVKLRDLADLVIRERSLPGDYPSAQEADPERQE